MEPAKTAFRVNQESFESYVSAEIDTKSEIDQILDTIPFGMIHQRASPFHLLP